MAQQTIGLGSSANDGTGDDLRTAGGKINANFTEVYGFVQSVAGETGAVSKAALLTAINVEDGAQVNTVASVAGLTGAITQGGLRGAINVEDGSQENNIVTVETGGDVDTARPTTDSDQIVAWLGIAEAPTNFVAGDIVVEYTDSRIDYLETEEALYGTMRYANTSEYTTTANLPVVVIDCGGDASTSRGSYSVSQVVIWYDSPTKPTNFVDGIDVWLAPDGHYERIPESTTTRTLAATDMGNVIETSHASGCAITIPLNATVDISASTEFAVSCETAGGTTVTIPTGGTINGTDNATITIANGKLVYLRQATANTWRANGDFT